MSDSFQQLQTRFKANWQWFKADARHFQILFLSTFLLYGLLELQWNAHFLSYGLIMGTALLTQYVGSRWKKVPFSAKSALITALGLCLLFKANSPAVYVLAAFLAIASKFTIRLQHKHVFNPANLGVVLPILLTADGWISPGQWGSGGMLLFLFGISGLFVLYRVKQLGTSLAFIATFAGLEFLRVVVYKGWPVDFWLHQFSSGSILLFTFFMITDPRTTPNHPKAKILWAIGIGILSFLLTEWFYVFTAPLWALFFSAPLTALLDRKIPAPRFHWLKKPELTVSTSRIHPVNS